MESSLRYKEEETPREVRQTGSTLKDTAPRFMEKGKDLEEQNREVGKSRAEIKPSTSRADYLSFNIILD
jgi:hypothetical protein